jgi:hypothetical protein
MAAITNSATTTTTTTTNQAEERSVISSLSPDDSAKTMMTSVSRMVETLGTVVNTLAKANANMAEETANTNDTIKQTMIQQTTTMHNFMIILTRNKERRQEVPIRVIQQTSTPNSTIMLQIVSTANHNSPQYYTQVSVKEK